MSNLGHWGSAPKVVDSLGPSVFQHWRATYLGVALAQNWFMIICWYTLGTQKVHRRSRLPPLTNRWLPSQGTFGGSPA
jgi:hypothetical protein